MSDLTSTSERPTEDRVQRVYRDTKRDPEFYEGHVWKVEYSEAYSHANRWFRTLQEANDYATQQEGFRTALADVQQPPPGFTADPTCGLCFPESHIDHCDGQTFSGPQRYSADGAFGVSTAWTSADGVELYIDQRPNARLDIAAAKELHSLLGSVLQEVAKS